MGRSRRYSVKHNQIFLDDRCSATNDALVAKCADLRAHDIFRSYTRPRCETSPIACSNMSADMTNATLFVG